MSKSKLISVDFSMEDPNGDEHFYKAYVKITFGTKEFFDKAWGNWLPGDPDEAEIIVAYELNPFDDDNWVPEEHKKEISTIPQDTVDYIIETAFELARED